MHVEQSVLSASLFNRLLQRIYTMTEESRRSGQMASSSEPSRWLAIFPPAQWLGTYRPHGWRATRSRA